MSGLFQLPGATRRDPAIEKWMDQQPEELSAIARAWFDVMRGCGDDVRELIHDDQPTACVGDAAFGYVDAFTAHVNVGFFNGADLEDPGGLLEGTGKFMRHVKIKPHAPVNESALAALIRASYAGVAKRTERQS
jgi:hypothetical protein